MIRSGCHGNSLIHSARGGELARTCPLAFVKCLMRVTVWIPVSQQHELRYVLSRVAHMFRLPHHIVSIADSDLSRTVHLILEPRQAPAA